MSYDDELDNLASEVALAFEIQSQGEEKKNVQLSPLVKGGGGTEGTDLGEFIKGQCPSTWRGKSLKKEEIRQERTNGGTRLVRVCIYG